MTHLHNRLATQINFPLGLLSIRTLQFLSGLTSSAKNLGGLDERYMILSIDVESDVFTHKTSRAGWEVGVPYILDTLSDLGLNGKVCWLIEFNVRDGLVFCNPSCEERFVPDYENVVEEIRKKRHQFGLHPTVYAYVKGRWNHQVPVSDPAFVQGLIHQGTMALSSVCKQEPVGCRTGNFHFAHSLAKALENERYLIDSSCRKGIFDPIKAPNVWFANERNHLVENALEPKTRILEIPTTERVRSGWGGVFSLKYKPSLVRINNQNVLFLSAFFHNWDAVTKEGKQDPAFKKALESLIDLALEKNVKFLSFSEAYERYKSIGQYSEEIYDYGYEGAQEKKETINVFVHVDADPVNACMQNSQTNKIYAQNGEMDWSSVLSTFDFLKAFSEKMGKQGLVFKSTFFLRADEQIKAVCKNSNDAFLRFNDEIKRLFCVGWHPHLLRWFDRHNCWEQEYRDSYWASQMLKRTFEDLKSQGFNVQFSKMGWCFHNNSSMKTLSELGIRADFSALPGARAPGRLVQGSFQDKYDWSKTRRQPYHPNENDYQSEGGLKMLEIPLTTYEVSGSQEFLYSVKLAFSSYRRLDFSYSPSFKRAVPLLLLDLTRLQSLKDFCENLLLRNKDYISLYLHPGELVNPTAQNMFQNFISQIISAADKRNLRISFVDAQELFDLCRANRNN